MRLIDADKLWDSIRNDVVPFNVAMISRHIHGSPTIDPETLPIVQELKQQLAEVTNERDAIIKAITGDCTYCGNSDMCKKYPCFCINHNMWKLKIKE